MGFNSGFKGLNSVSKHEKYLSEGELLGLTLYSVNSER